MTTPVDTAAVDTAEPAEVVEDTGDVLRVRFPVLVVEGMDAGDGRLITAGNFGCRPLPLSIAAQPYEPHGGQPAPAAEVFGRITTAQRHPGPEVVSPSTGKPYPEGVWVWSAEGEIDATHRWANLVRKGYLRGVSVVMGEMDAELVSEEDAALSDNPRRWAVVNSANIACVTLVPVPAFADTHLELVGDDTAMVAAAELPPELNRNPVPPWVSADLGDPAAFSVPAGQRREAKKEGDTYPGTDKFPIDTRDHAKSAIRLHGSSDIPAAKVKAWLIRRLKAKGWADLLPDDWTKDSSVTAAAPLRPPAGWFTDPQLDAPTALTITGDGRVYGHLAAWDTPHIGFPGQHRTAPRSVSDYAYFAVGAVLCDDGSEVAVGHITMDTGHAAMSLGHPDVTAHYDNTGAVVADVAAGEDSHGIWVAGALRPGVTEEQAAKLRASALSGDWRRIGTDLELVAALAVNTPGFPVPRARIKVGRPVALVAAGVLQPTEQASAVLDYDTMAAAVVSRMRATEAEERERAALAAELADDDSDEERLTALAELDEGDEFTALAALVSEHADVDDATFASLMPPQLQRSYLTGKVAARIVWGTPGDFRRCVAQAKVHGMGRKAEGACNYLHNKANGFYPGDRRNR